MIIEYCRDYENIKFEDIDEGDVFSYSNTFYIKIQEYEGINAASLKDGSLNSFGDKVNVEVTDCRLLVG